MPNWDAIKKSVSSLLSNQQGLTTQFKWNDRILFGCRTELRREDVNSDEGLVCGNYVFSLLCAASQFAGVFPAPRVDKIRINNDEFRVLSTRLDSIGATLTINLGSILM